MNVLDIFNVYEEYKKRYSDVEYPRLTENNLSYANDVNFWFEFSGKELYANNYNLVICMKAFCLKDEHIKSMLFHEFTHLHDSIILKSLPYDEFQNIMASYSEINAAYVEFEYLFSSKSISTKTKMRHLDRAINIGNWFQKELCRIQRIWGNMEFESISEFMDELKLLCYFIGKYTYLHSRIPSINLNIESPFQPEINAMIEKYKCKDYSLATEFSQIIKKYRTYHNTELAKEFASLTNGAISIEELLEHTGQVNKNL